MTQNVQLCAEISLPALQALLGEYGLKVVMLPDGADIPGSYWGAPEAGLVLDSLYIRPDTPTHSALHEAGHWICMDEARRAKLHTDAGDMTIWGYSYREGSVYTWLEGDAADAIAWLQRRGLIDGDRQRITHP